MAEPEYPPGTLEFWAHTQPGNAAYVDRDGTLTFQELDDGANRLASALAARGFAAGDPIAVRSRVRAEWFIVHRALGKLGCHQVLLSWRLTPAEAAHIAADSGARAVICDDEDPAALTEALRAAGLAAPITLPPDYRGLLAEGAPEHRPTPLLTSMVIYTSGTTGRPRGVHAGNRLSKDPAAYGRYQGSLLTRPPMSPGARLLLTLPLHHGAGPLTAAVAHATGGTVYGLDPYDPEEALRLINEHRITHWTAVPTMLLRIQALPAEVFARYDVSSLETVTVGAAPVPQSLKAWFAEAFGEVLWEAYGTSETGMLTYLDPKDAARKPGSSGVPHDEVRIRIVDDEWNTVPAGETGEIAVHTPALIGKYVGEPDMARDTLSEDGFFRTGDVGHLDSDGFLFIVDRRKDMIVAGGVNIYPAEIEAALIEHPDVLDVAVIGVPEETFGEQPKAFIELRPGSTATAEDIVASTEDRLAKYKRPRIVEFVDELPRNPMGKVKKFVLRDAEWKDRERKI
jgi:long-chain acyl-CoA synthetase